MRAPWMYTAAASPAGTTFSPTSAPRPQETAPPRAAARARAEALPDRASATSSKLLFNATVNGIPAITGLPHDFHFADREHLGDLVPALMAEGKRVAAAARIELHDDPWEMNV